MRGYQRPEPATDARTFYEKRAVIGESSTRIVTWKSSAPADSWWTRPVQSREEFDQLAAQRCREAGWTGRSVKEQGHE